MESNCPNMKKLFGREYRVRLSAEYRQQQGIPMGEKPWYFEILCQKSSSCTIVPWDTDRLAVIRDRGQLSKVTRDLLSIKSASLEQDGSDGQNISFDVADFPAVAKITKARRRRRLSEEQLLELRKRLATVL